METIANISALLTVVLNGIAALVGGYLWWRVTPRTWAWTLIRVGQGATLLLAVVAGVAWFSGARPTEGLFWLYALLPVGIGFFAEQCRILSAQTGLEARGIEDAQAV